MVGLFGFMSTLPDALAAINAPLGTNDCVAVPDSDRLRGTAFEAGRTALTFSHIQRDGMLVLFHASPHTLK